MYSTEVTEKYMIWNEPNINVQPMLYLYNLGGHWVHFLNSYIIRSLSKYTYMDCWDIQIKQYLFCNMTILSAYRSEKSKPFPFSLTSGCFLTSSHPTCAKKNPLLALCGSASVSEYLWWTLWSRDQSKMSF